MVVVTHVLAALAGALVFFVWLAWEGICDVVRPWTWRELRRPIAWDVRLTRRWFDDGTPEVYRSRTGRLVYV